VAEICDRWWGGWPDCEFPGGIALVSVSSSTITLIFALAGKGTPADGAPLLGREAARGVKIILRIGLDVPIDPRGRIRVGRIRVGFNWPYSSKSKAWIYL
jgi:hypothetical protein